MEFTLNVNLNLSEATERTLNRLADAFGSTKSLSHAELKELEEEAWQKEVVQGFKKTEEKVETVEEVKEVIEETPKTTRTRKPVAPKVEETVVEEAKLEVVEKGTGDFVPDAVAIRALAIPLAKAGHGVKEKLTELGYGGIGQLSEGGNEEHIKTFYAWLLEETKSLK
jgi:hypothetical protein